MGFLDFGKKKDDTGKKTRKTLKRNKRLAQDLAKKAPSAKKLQADLISPELQGLLEHEALALPSQIREDEKLKREERDLLASFDERSKGETQDDKGIRKQLLREMAASGTAQRKAVDQEMAQRGMSSSGSSYIAKLLAGESANDRASQQGENLLSRIDANKMANLQQKSNLASNLQARNINLQKQNQQANQAIQQYNLGNKMNIARSNLGMRQDIANQNANIRNQEALQHANAYQQAYANKAGAYQGMMGANTQIAQSYQLDPKPTSTGMGMLAGALIGGKLGGGAQGAAAGAGVGENIEAGVAKEDGGVLHAQNGLESAQPSIWDKVVSSVKNTFTPAPEAPKEDYSKWDKEKLEKTIHAKTLANMDNQEKEAEKQGYIDLAKTFSGGNKPQQEAKHINLETPSIKVDPSIGGNQYTPIENNYEDGGNYCSDGKGDIVPGDSYERDRVDAKLNSGEMVLNAVQQQRLFDLIKGKIGLKDLPEDDIVEGVPKEYQEEIKNKDDMSVGFKKLLTMLGK